MKKLVMEGPKVSKLIEVEKPTLLNENCAIVKIKYCGVCRSEHYDWSHAKPGISFGHEGVGVVCEIGKNVTNIKVGDRVSGPFYGGAEYICTDATNCIKIPDNVSDEAAVACKSCRGTGCKLCNYCTKGSEIFLLQNIYIGDCKMKS